MSDGLLMGVFVLAGCVGLANLLCPVKSPLAIMTQIAIDAAIAMPSAQEACRRANEQAEAVQLRLYDQGRQP